MTCAKGHPLTSLGTSRNNGWACDARKAPGGCRAGITGFFQSDGLGRYRCDTCDYDLCEKCHATDGGSQSKSLQMADDDRQVSPQHWRLSVMSEISMLPGLSCAGADAKNAFGRVALDTDELKSMQGLLDASARKIYTRDRRGGKVPDRLEVTHGFRIQNRQNWLDFAATQDKIRLAIEALKSGGTVGVCSEGHELAPLGTTRDNGWACDGRKDAGGCCSGITGYHQTTRMNRFRCQPCDFDYCEKCYLMRTGSKLCPKGHPLVPLGTSRDNGWGCNARKTPSGCLRDNVTKGVNRFRCKECDFDLCDRCFQMHVGHINNSVAGLKTAGVDLLGPPLDEETNTVWLFHGTNDQAAEQITRGDFLVDKAGSNAGTLYGRGIYLAESCSKSDEYTQQNDEGLRCMILCRATLGNVLYNDEKAPNVESLVRQCRRGTFHSVLGDREKTRGTFREFIVYDDDQVYPEFTMWYKRVYQPAPE